MCSHLKISRNVREIVSRFFCFFFLLSYKSKKFVEIDMGAPAVRFNVTPHSRRTYTGCF